MSASPGRRLAAIVAGAVGLATLAALAPAGARSEAAPFVVVLGVAQDAGYPQAGCRAACCERVWGDPVRRRGAACLGIVDPVTHERWLVEATPDLRDQLRHLDRIEPPAETPGLAGILLTHAHIGHYAGLMFIGHESIGAHGVPVYAMPRMRAFLSSHGPWDQLVRFENIRLRPIEADVPVRLNDRLEVTAFRVPHRDEYTEVVGYRIAGPERSVLFIPDIDKWERWSRRLEDVLATVDVAYLDGTFYADGELPDRDMSKIPHPFIAETMSRLASLPPAERAKVRFIHLNHTNPALDPASAASRSIDAAGFRVARQGERVDL